jgi:hypothetical protein
MKIKEVILTEFGTNYLFETKTYNKYNVCYRVKYAKDDKISCTHFNIIKVPKYILPEQKMRYFKLSIMKEYNGTRI